MRDALNKTGRQICFSLCGWSKWYAEVGTHLGNSWRIDTDVLDWSTLYRTVRTNEKLGRFAVGGTYVCVVLRVYLYVCVYDWWTLQR
jgi:hypothetical protein